MRDKRLVIKVTHEFVEDSAAVRRAYDTWAMLLARELDLGHDGEIPQRSPRKRRNKGTA